MINGCEVQKRGSAEAESWRLPEPAFLPKSASNTTVPQHTRGHSACPQHGPVSLHVNTELCWCSWNFPKQPWVCWNFPNQPLGFLPQTLPSGSAPPRHETRLHLYIGGGRSGMWSRRVGAPRRRDAGMG